MKLERHENGGYEIFSRLAVGWDGSTVGQGTDIEVLMRGRVSITAVNGNDLKHIPNDPTLQRMIDYEAIFGKTVVYKLAAALRLTTHTNYLLLQIDDVRDGYLLLLVVPLFVYFVLDHAL